MSATWSLRDRSRNSAYLGQITHHSEADASDQFDGKRPGRKLATLYRKELVLFGGTGLSSVHVFHDCPHLGTEQHELSQARRLPKILARPKVQRALPVLRTVRGTEDDHLYMAAFRTRADALENFFTADLRQVQIQQHHVRRRLLIRIHFLDEFKGSRPVPHDVQLTVESLFFKGFLDQIYVRRIILHQQDVWFFSPHWLRLAS